MSSIFISYRRTGTSGYGGRLQDDLGEHFGRGRVFRDIDSIRPGTEFAEVIDKAIAQAGVVLALIGRNWLNAANKRRLNDPHDFVRLEIESALKQGIVVLPVLIEGAKIPSASRLPESLVRLGRTQGIELTDDRWAYDLSRLIGVLEGFVGPATRPVVDEATAWAVAEPAPSVSAADVDAARTAGAPSPSRSPAPQGPRSPKPGGPQAPGTSKPAPPSSRSREAGTADAGPPPDAAGLSPRLVLVDQRGQPVRPEEHPVVVAPPGLRTAAGVRVRGCGQLVDAIGLQVEGCPADWLGLEPVVQLRPEGSAELAVMLAPPRAWATAPGFYRVTLTVHHTMDRAVVSNRVRLRLRVPQYTAPEATVVDGPPQERTCRTGLLRARDAGFAVAVHNGGNGPLGAQLSVTADDLVTRVWPASIWVAAGGDVQVRVRATPRRRWVGAPSTAPVKVAVTWDTGEEATTLAVPLTHRPLLSAARGGSTPTAMPVRGSGHDPRVAATAASPQQATPSSQGDI